MQTLERAFSIFQSLPAPTKHHNVLSVLDRNEKLYSIIQYPGQTDYYEELYDIEKDKVVFTNSLKKTDVRSKFKDLITYGSPTIVYVDRDGNQGMSKTDNLVFSARIY